MNEKYVIEVNKATAKCIAELAKVVAKAPTNQPIQVGSVNAVYQHLDTLHKNDNNESTVNTFMRSIRDIKVYRDGVTFSAINSGVRKSYAITDKAMYLLGAKNEEIGGIWCKADRAESILQVLNHGHIKLSIAKIYLVVNEMAAGMYRVTYDRLIVNHKDNSAAEGLENRALGNIEFSNSKDNTNHGDAWHYMNEAGFKCRFSATNKLFVAVVKSLHKLTPKDEWSDMAEEILSKFGAIQTDDDIWVIV